MIRLVVVSDIPYLLAYAAISGQQTTPVVLKEATLYIS